MYAYSQANVYGKKKKKHGYVTRTVRKFGSASQSAMELSIYPASYKYIIPYCLSVCLILSMLPSKPKLFTTPKRARYI